MTKSESRMQLPEDMENIVKAFALPYRDPKSHKMHKEVMAQMKRISKCWRRLLRKDVGGRRSYLLYRLLHLPFTACSPHILPPPFVKKVQRCFLPNF